MTIPTKDIAVHLGLEWFYDYVFGLTSTVVHFEPGHLLRTGWGDENTFKFSMKNMNGYYREVGRFVSLFLLVVYGRRIGPWITNSSKFRNGIDSLWDMIMRMWRWPEPLSYEEMNVSTPSFLPYSMHAALWDRSEINRLVAWRPRRQRKLLCA